MTGLISQLEGHSLVVRNNLYARSDARGGKMPPPLRVYDGRGVSDLYRLLTEGDFLNGADVADKVVGKGAAALMILGGVKRVHALVISRPALALFANSTVTVTFDKSVDTIINRAGTGPCPVETLCADCTTAAQCLPLISTFVEKLKMENYPLSPKA